MLEFCSPWLPPQCGLSDKLARGKCTAARARAAQMEPYQHVHGQCGRDDLADECMGTIARDSGPCALFDTEADLQDAQQSTFHLDL